MSTPYFISSTTNDVLTPVRVDRNIVLATRQLPESGEYRGDQVVLCAHNEWQEDSYQAFRRCGDGNWSFFGPEMNHANWLAAEQLPDGFGNDELRDDDMCSWLTNLVSEMTP